MKVCPHCGKQYPNTMTLCSADTTVLQSVDDPLLGQTLAGKYLVETLIKRGGMGAVYRGKHVLMDKTVAIKVLRPALAVDDDIVARFSREAKAASRISHPHAVSVTDFGESENGVVFLVMEYLDGRTLKEIIRSEGPLPLKRVVEIIRQVTGALDAAHGQGVVHRDLKSDNIMLSQTNGGDWAKVLDFGIAKIQQPANVKDADITAPNLVVGTPQYMSPEQCSQTQPLDARSDVYSLGVIVYEMLAGRVPFTGESVTMIMMKQVQDTPPPILATRPDLPAAVDKVITQALAKHPADRFQTAGELFAALATAAAEGVSAAPRAAETVAGVPVSPAADDLNEETVVRPRETPPYASAAAAPTPQASLSPWRIIVPSAIVLVVVFGVVFLLTRSAGQTPPKQTQGQTELAADPNSQPVQPASPPNGASERGIQPLAVASPTVGNANTNANANQSLPPDVLGNFGANANGNDNASGRGNKNTNQPRESPTPKSLPSTGIKTETPPPPKPSPSVKSVSKPTATPPGERR
ncbi:MAG TPA: serine/threonine-protein kinase [Pyrinomonadaceae bacterium]|nr:serine/threonine-protein kinase [Pyrinomonadaceae bacterium]